MAKIKVTEEDIKSLELISNLAYNKLKQGIVETPDSFLIALAENLYKNDLGRSLTQLVIRSTWSVTNLKKGGKRAKPIEKYILQYVLNTERRRGTYTHEVQIVEDLEDGMGGLKAFLDAEDKPTQQKSEVFKLIQQKATQVRDSGRYDLLLNALNYVRGQYA